MHFDNVRGVGASGGNFQVPVCQTNSAMASTILTNVVRTVKSLSPGKKTHRTQGGWAFAYIRPLRDAAGATSLSRLEPSCFDVIIAL